MTNLIWDILQQQQISETDSRVAIQAGRQEGLAQRVGDAEDRVNRIALVHTAMMELIMVKLAQKGMAITPQELEAKIREVDMRDGRSDGKLAEVKVGPRTCSACQRPVGRRFSKCMYCGANVSMVEG